MNWLKRKFDGEFKLCRDCNEFFPPEAIGKVRIDFQIGCQLIPIDKESKEERFSLYFDEHFIDMCKECIARANIRA